MSSVVLTDATLSRAGLRRPWPARSAFCCSRGMWSDVLDLEEFCCVAHARSDDRARLLRTRLREIWPNVRGETVLGLGYAQPLLRPFMEEAGRTLAFMPAQQGVTRWPREGRNLSTLVDELDFARCPIARSTAWCCGPCRRMHRAAAPDVARNLARDGRWRPHGGRGADAHLASGRRFRPLAFLSGPSYSAGQLNALLRANMFAPLRQTRALYMPPTRSRLTMRMAPTIWERFGQRWLGRFGGGQCHRIRQAASFYAGIAEAQPAAGRRRTAQAACRQLARHPAGYRGCPQRARTAKSPPPDSERTTWHSLRACGLCR